MPTITITSDQKIKSVHIEFAEDGAASVDVKETSSPSPEFSRLPEGLPKDLKMHPSAEVVDLDELEIDHADFDSIAREGLEIAEDKRKTVGESLADVDFEAPLSSVVQVSAIEVPDVEGRPSMIDEGMGEEL